MRKFITSILFLTVILFSSACAQETFLSKFYKKYSPAIVSVEGLDTKSLSYLPLGTGFFYKNNIIITAKHVVDEDIPYRISYNKKIFSVKRIYKSSKIYNDSAIIVLKEDVSDSLSLKISSDLPEVGLRAIVIGNPLDYYNVLSDGFINAIIYDKFILGCNGMISISNPIAPGNSGGPVFNESGEVLGIIFSRRGSYSNFNTATSSGYILDTIKEYNKSNDSSILLPIMIKLY